MTKREENRLYNAATKRFIAKWNEIFSTNENITNAIKARQSFVDRYGNSDQLFLLNDKVCYHGNDEYSPDINRINETITQYFGEETANTLSLDNKIILDAAIAGALSASKGHEDYTNYAANNMKRSEEISDRFDNIPKTAFETIDINLLLLKMKVSDFDSSNNLTFKNALNNLVIELHKKPDPIIVNATITLLKNLSELPQKLTQKQITQIFTEYETACKTSNASKNVLKAVGVVIITGICFAAGIVAGAVLGGAVGLAAGAWSGPGAAFSAILGVFKGSLTGWAIAATATAAVTGVVFGTTGAASSTSSLFFKPSAVDKAVADIVALSPKMDDEAESTDDFSPNR